MIYETFDNSSCIHILSDALTIIFWQFRWIFIIVIWKPNWHFNPFPGALIEQLSNNSYECMVCCEIIKREQAVWSCGNCYHVFHLRCVKKWARSPAAAIEGSKPKPKLFKNQPVCLYVDLLRLINESLKQKYNNDLFTWSGNNYNSDIVKNG